MGFCSARHIFLFTCILQMIGVIERQVFDFLGFLWIPILINFCEIIFTILGFFGAYQCRVRYVLSYIIWNLLWTGWNIFLICLYLDLGTLDHMTNKVLKLDTKSESWWRTEGPNCKQILTPETEPEGDVENCLLDYIQVEIFQAGFQCIVTVIGSLFGIYLVKKFLNDDDILSRKNSPRKSQRTTLYSIEFSSELDNHQRGTGVSDIIGQIPPTLSPKPMTPRKVKRRSVMTRGTTARHSTSNKRHTGTARSSTRSSRRSVQNPITRLMDQQNSMYDESSLVDSSYFTSSNNNLGAYGHANLTYQQSSTQSLNETDDFDELYNNRPASVRSSYSNFHGTRSINYGTTSSSKTFHHSHATPQVPQKKLKPPGRSSMRSKVFLNNGPPAYSSHSPVSPGDSETPM